MNTPTPIHNPHNTNTFTVSVTLNITVNAADIYPHHSFLGYGLYDLACDQLLSLNMPANMTFDHPDDILTAFKPVF